MAKKAANKKVVQKYKSVYSGKPITIQQFLVELLYKNRGINDITKYLGGNAWRQKEYRKTITIISRLIKKTEAQDLATIIIKSKVKKPEDLPWRIEKLEYIKQLEQKPKDYTEPERETFDPGTDLRNKGQKTIKKLSKFEQISELGDSNE